jgi:hypothetical protein
VQHAAATEKLAVAVAKHSAAHAASVSGAVSAASIPNAAPKG